jgi:hypothetical protein
MDGISLLSNIRTTSQYCWTYITNTNGEKSDMDAHPPDYKLHVLCFGDNLGSIIALKFHHL